MSSYPNNFAFSPGENFPEYPFKHIESSSQNHVYSSVRSLLNCLRLDESNYGNSTWNPLGCIIKEGDNVIIKPNMVMESHLGKPDEFEYILTHGSVIRAICDYVVIALKNRGSVVFADSPETDANFDMICKRNGLYEILNFYKENVNKISFKIMDLRKEYWIKKDGVIIKKRKLSGDPNGYTKVSLNELSEFKNYDLNEKFFGANFNRHETKKHHSFGKHEYLISSTILNSDVIINVPKLKTHKKAGLTCCLKNLVGINGDKNWLPHYTLGCPKGGGDQFPKDNIKAVVEYKVGGLIKNAANRFLLLSYIAWLLKPFGRQVFGSTEKIVRSGNWHGNDTIWRMIIDLNKCLFYYDSYGRIIKSKRKMFCIVDAIIAGDNMGPLNADPKNLGFLVGGFDPVLVDRTCAQLVGFNYRKIPSICNCFNVKSLPFTQKENDKIHIVSNLTEFNGELENLTSHFDLHFKPHFGWKGHIEL